MSDLPFDWRLPYPSQRAPVLADNLVATSQPLAVQAGLRILQRGGNAIDAAVATAIALVVVEPTNNGVGSDAFAIVWDGHRLHGINGSGKSPTALDVSRIEVLGDMPSFGWDAVTVPGAVSVWAALSKRFGKLPFADLFAPAIHYAREGYAVAPITATQWQMVEGLYQARSSFAEAFLPAGRAPHAGERFSLPALADTLEEIARTGGESLYRGRLAERIATAARGDGADLAASDLHDHQPLWVEPLFLDYRGWRVHELPPNGQGLATLIALGILEHFPLGEMPADSAESLHLQIEAMKLAIADTRRHVADPNQYHAPIERLLSRDYLAGRAAGIDPNQAHEVEAGGTLHGDTVYLTTADGDGRMVSYIQSNYFAFGSGIVVPASGISLQNRGACFTLEAGHPNRVAGGKRPFHTIMPGFLTKNGRAVMSFGVMGGPMQPQGHLQVVVRIVDNGENPQAAIDAPRWQVFDRLDVVVEQGMPTRTIEELMGRGHVVRYGDSAAFGGAQAIYRFDGGYLGASDPRKDGLAGGF